MLSQQEIEQYGETLYNALRTCIAIDPLTDVIPDFNIKDAYQIQRDMVQRRLAEEGSKIIGWKIGVTSEAVQTMLNVGQPDFGHLLSTMVHGDRAILKRDDFIQPRAEGEIAFLLSKDLKGPVNAADVFLATEYIAPCFEIVDSRIRDWKIKIEDTIADNASSGAFVIGDKFMDPRDLNLSTIGMVIEKNGEVVGTGAGAATLGHPVNAVVWLANTLSSLGIELEKGCIILSGALSALVPIEAGDSLRMSLGGVGSASVKFT